MDDRTKRIPIDIKGLEDERVQTYVENNLLWILFRGTTHVKSVKFMKLTIQNTVFYAGCALGVDVNVKLELKEAIFMQGTYSFKM